VYNYNVNGASVYDYNVTGAWDTQAPLTL
jgi:hypothetical protein